MKIISGMHRSGTSLLAQLFFEVGADMGDQSTFYRPDKWNTDGYFEQPDIHAINMPLINGFLWKFSYFILPSTETILKRATHRADQIRQTADNYRDKVIKETRFCLTLPAWLRYGANIEKILICLRDPIQVAYSLKKRNKITLKKAYSLWLIHNQRLIDNAGDIPLWFVYYSNLFDRDRAPYELSPAFQFLGMDISEGKVSALIESIVKPQMNHNAYQQVADYPEPVDLLWRHLLDRHARQFENL